jgi:predicted GH43/DUF377 family glycosyl hydrolase
MKRFAHRQHIVSVLVLILAITAWLPRAQGAGSLPITPLLAGATLIIASVASAEQGAHEQAPSPPQVLLIGDSICGAGIWSMSIIAGVAGEGDAVLSVPQVRALAGTDHWAVYPHNPVLRCGASGEWDAGALGSMTVLKVGELFHMYYEAWGVRGNSAMDYNTLQIGHATSRDGVHWTKDPANPVLPKGTGKDWDRDGTWDPFVLYEDGVFEMWYGGGPDGNSGWGYAVSHDGSHFQKNGRLPSPWADLNHAEDDHVVHDKPSGRHFMYYWDRKHEPMGLFRAQSATETDFDFAHAEPIRIEGLKHPAMYKFAHVIQSNGKWHMFFAEFVRPGCKGCHTGYATSSDGLHWTAQNTNLLVGQDGEVLKVADDLWLMYYGPDGYFDQKGCDIRLAVFRGKPENLATNK